MTIEYVPVFDEDGNSVGCYTESVPDRYVKEEPDCYVCCDRGCGECDGSEIDRLNTWTFTGTWPETPGGWGAAPY